jgi:hypothetical protein
MNNLSTHAANIAAVSSQPALNPSDRFRSRPVAFRLASLRMSSAATMYEPHTTSKATRPVWASLRMYRMVQPYSSAASLQESIFRPASSFIAMIMRPIVPIREPESNRHPQSCTHSPDPGLEPRNHRHPRRTLLYAGDLQRRGRDCSDVQSFAMLGSLLKGAGP